MHQRITTLIVASMLCLGLGMGQHLSGKESDLAFANPTQAQTLLNHPGYVVITAFYCANCPGARRRVTGEIKQMHDIIESERLPAVILLVTPDREPDYLQNFAENNNLNGAVFAQDKKNALNISLNNIWQMNSVFQGQRLRSNPGPENLLSYVAEHKTSYRFPVEGIENDRAKQLWWMVERGHPEGVATLAEASTRRNPLQEDAQRIREVVEPVYRKHEEALVKAEPSIDTVEALEALIKEARALGMNDAQQRLRELQRDRSLRDELTARQAYQRINDELVASNNRRQREQAPAAFQQLAERFPETKYGRKAAAKNKNHSAGGKH